MSSRTFRIMDDNGSRTLDRDELMKGLYDYGLKFTKAEVTQILTDIDKDRSGQISFNEFLQALRVSHFSFVFLSTVIVAGAAELIQQGR